MVKARCEVAYVSGSKFKARPTIEHIRIYSEHNPSYMDYSAGSQDMLRTNSYDAIILDTEGMEDAALQLMREIIRKEGSVNEKSYVIAVLPKTLKAGHTPLDYCEAGADMMLLQGKGPQQKLECLEEALLEAI
ncbi:MAG: hypothetical protein KJ709_09105 [Nanoarchaeota archaeon]|nr:hypothetical protein [Nanoarchaeota archaeon]